MRKLNTEEIKKIELDILKEFHDYCEKEKLTYFMYYGTLLGAVRHQGYIPWDDDIDVCMFREDYDKLAEKFNNGRKDRLVFKCVENDDDYQHTMGKIMDMSTEVIEPSRLKDKMGVYIDIFPMDYLPDDEKERAIVLEKQNKNRMMFLRNNKQLKHQKNFFKKIGLLGTKLMVSLIGARKIAVRMNQTARQANNGKKSSLCGAFASYIDRELIPTKAFENKQLMDFEQYKFYAPIDSDRVLTDIYGDYMQLPPEEKRYNPHELIAYEL